MTLLWLLITHYVLIIADAAMCPNNENTDEMRNTYLKYHNDARSRLAKGQESDMGRKLGPAKNIYKLSWSCELEKIAKELAKGCGYDFSRYKSYGQNRQTFNSEWKSKEFDVNKLIKESLDTWWGKSKKAYIPQDNKYQPSVYEFSNKYDCELEVSSAKHARNCQFQHSKGTGFGENLFIIYTPKFDKRVIAEMATEGWYEELEDFGVGKANILTQQLFDRPGQIGHYTQTTLQRVLSSDRKRSKSDADGAQSGM
ncbi:hypothetical protein KIN20_022612 [Parelaphostrongylus tenuis]|uniref:SCP domain-containing protein n=1 Tax=Parelaphostrongylus tenuis TaxID=148309 RepID=A0AAD5NBP9_PARTN|nr:hypothetical protein KIN20_022612 [Parelaphostrongylus tenuis]